MAFPSRPAASTGLKIGDLENGGLNFDLLDVLEAVGPAPHRRWQASFVSAVGPDGGDHPWGDSWDEEHPLVIDDATLWSQAGAVLQVINGRFSALGDDSESLVIEAIDSSFWIVWSDDPDIRARLSERFNNVAEVSPPTPFGRYG